MRALLDTHAFLWWIADSGRLSGSARDAIADESNEIAVSAASAWEIATKYRLGKLPGGDAIATDVVGQIAGQGFVEMAIGVADAERAGRLPGPAGTFREFIRGKTTVVCPSSVARLSFA